MSEAEQVKRPKYIPVREEACEVSMLYTRIAELKDYNEKLLVEVKSLRQLLENK